MKNYIEIEVKERVHILNAQQIVSIEVNTMGLCKIIMVNGKEFETEIDRYEIEKAINKSNRVKRSIN